MSYALCSSEYSSVNKMQQDCSCKNKCLKCAMTKLQLFKLFHGYEEWYTGSCNYKVQRVLSRVTKIYRKTSHWKSPANLLKILYTKRSVNNFQYFTFSTWPLNDSIKGHNREGRINIWPPYAQLIPPGALKQVYFKLITHGVVTLFEQIIR